MPPPTPNNAANRPAASPIAASRTIRPEGATASPAAGTPLLGSIAVTASDRRLAELLAPLRARVGLLGFVSGRGLADVERLVELDGCAYAGFHARGAPDPDAAGLLLREVAREAAGHGLVTTSGREVLEVRPPVGVDGPAGALAALSALAH